VQAISSSVVVKLDECTQMSSCVIVELFSKEAP